MKKNIDDYIHLYLGCNAYWQIQGVKSTYAAPIDYSMLENADWIKPVLRPLHDMTMQEAEPVASMAFTDALSKEEKGKIGKAFIEYNFSNAPLFSGGKMYHDISEIEISMMPEITRYLLTKGFDLFGLIEEGLAVNACELKTGSIA